jgi:UDP-N-acetylglucosamine diphosphorylase/glucosamine-1-phosphate N-acetyltransferase
LLLYEDPHWRSLRPITDLTPVPALTFGASHLAERWMRFTGLPLLAIEARPRALAAWAAAPRPAPGSTSPGDQVQAINAAALPGPWLAAAREASGPALLVSGGRIAGARAPYATLAPGLGRGEGFEGFLETLDLPVHEVAGVRFLSHPWNLVEWNAEAIAEDLAGSAAKHEGDVHAQAVLLAPERIAIGREARIEPLSVLDARGGPIRIGARALIRSHTVVVGPCAVGEGTQLLGGSIARSSFGPECRIAGEVEECVWQGWANKRHHGFVGHSTIGEWVNLGALTTTSDLKNNYANVRVWVDGAELDSGSPKVGSHIGAHVKTGIGTLLPTGASLGIGANLFGGGRFAPRRVPSFAWWDGQRTAEHELEKFLATARTAMARRDRKLSPADEAQLREAFVATAKERQTGVAS